MSLNLLAANVTERSYIQNKYKKSKKEQRISLNIYPSFFFSNGSIVQLESSHLEKRNENIFFDKICRNIQLLQDQESKNQMNILDHEEVLNHELQLLDLPGEALSNFYIYHSDNSAFMTPSSSQADRYFRQCKMKKIKSCGNRVNSQFTMLTCILMKIMFGPHKRTDLLQKLKCTLYSPDVKLDRIIALPPRDLDSNLMKKILVEFFQVMQYHQGPCQPILDKYLIVLEIFTLFFRTILTIMNVSNAEHYNKQVSQNETIPIILDYFDINYQTNKDTYIIFQEQIAIHFDSKTGESFYGNIGNDVETQETEQLEDNGGFNFQYSSEMYGYSDDDKKQHAPTPCFGEFSQQEVNFNRKGLRKNSLNQNKLKMMAFENKIKDEMIQEENQDEEQDQKRRNSVQYRRNSEDICQKVYFDFQDQGEKQELKAVQSPKVSSPAEDIDLQRDFEGLFTPKEKNLASKFINPQNQQGFNMRMQKIQESTSKSDIFKPNRCVPDRKVINHMIIPRSNTEADKNSISSKGSCTCTENKLRKIQFHSNVIDLCFKPDFTRKPNSPNQIHSLRTNGKQQYDSLRSTEQKSIRHNQTYKIPAFLAKRQNMKTEYGSKDNAFNTSHKFVSKPPPIMQQVGGPKINFSYTMKKQQHIMTQPARSQYYSNNQRGQPNGRQIWSAYNNDRRLNNLPRPPSYF